MNDDERHDELLERRARALGDAVDGLIGDSTARQAPAALDEDALQTAAIIRASLGEPSLGAERGASIVASAIDEADGAPNRRRWWNASWLSAAAAIVIVAFGVATLWTANEPAPAPALGAVAAKPTVGTRARTWPPHALSRASDALLGRPITDRAGASRRLDRVFADRLRGYRTVAFAGATP